MWNNDSSILFSAMINRSIKSPLEKTHHFLQLEKLINICNPCDSLVDIGCGAGELGRVHKNKKYLGLDLQNIIENVAKVKNSNLNYICFNACDEQIPNEVNKYDVIVMNSFLSELIDPISFLKKLFLIKNKYIIIHRQNFTNKTTYIEKYSSYAGLISTNSYINNNEFIKLIETFNYKILQKIQSGIEEKESVLLIKN